MNIRAIARMVALYTVILGVVTVGGVYVVFHSGLYILIIAAAGLLLVGLGGGSLGAVSPSATRGTEEAEISEMMGEHIQPRPSMTAFGVRLALILYGIGLVVWSIIVLAFFRSGLQ